MSIPANKYELHIQIEIRSQPYSGGGLTLREDFNIDAADFMEMCRILGQFDELAKKLRKQ